MKQILSSSLVKQSLGGHSWVGLLVGALMYLVCLSGTLAVFYEEFERWEQPQVSEYRNYDPAVVDQAFNAYLASGVTLTDHMYLVLPTDSIPRVSVASDLEGRFVNPDGSLAEATGHDWTHMLLDLHLYLHLPESWGMILVSALGALLCGLIISGFLAHPRIFRDAFSLRLSGSKRLEQVDIHNRLSVWGAPFHLIIAVTGAWFGLVLLVLALYAGLTGGDSTAIVNSVFGEEPVLEQTTRTVAVEKALLAMPEIAPDAEPMYITVHGAGTPGQFMEVYGRHEDRLIWSENYLFDTEGNYLGKDGFSDGEAGKQAVFSVYRLHFGHFGGLWVKLLYGVLGMALTVVSVTGINIWLERRKTRDFLNPLWAGFVWGSAAALALSILAEVIFHIPAAPVFWLGLAGASACALKQGDAGFCKTLYQGLCSALLLLFLLAYVLRFGLAAFAPAALGVNLALLATALLLGWLAWRQRPLQTERVKETALLAPAARG